MAGELPLIARWIIAARYHPATALLFTGSLFGWFIGSFFYSVPQPFVFGGITGPEKWRLISPIFVHFGLMHFVFNGLWLCLLGALGLRWWWLGIALAGMLLGWGVKVWIGTADGTLPLR